MARALFGQAINRSPAIRGMADGFPVALVHSAQRNHWRAAQSRQPGETIYAKSVASGMAICSKHRRYQHNIRAGLIGLADLARIVRSRQKQKGSAAYWRNRLASRQFVRRPINAICTPVPRLTHRSTQNHDMAKAFASMPQRLIAHPPRPDFQMIVPEDHSRPSREACQGRFKLFVIAGIAHQPDRWQLIGVAAVHDALYSPVHAKAKFRSHLR